jgi:hypothetical protein
MGKEGFLEERLTMRVYISEEERVLRWNLTNTATAQRLTATFLLYGKDQAEEGEKM